MEATGRDGGDKLVAEEEAHAIDEDHAVVLVKAGRGDDAGQRYPHVMNFDDIRALLLEDVGLKGRPALTGEDLVAEQTEIDDAEITGVEEDGAHVGSGVQEIPFPGGSLDDF